MEEVFADLDDENYPQLQDEEEDANGMEFDEPDPTSFLEQSMGFASSGSAAAASNNITEYYCPLCQKYFETRQKWLYHRYYHIREEKYDCVQCSEKFKLRSHLERHIRTYHNDEKPVSNFLTCDQCPRKFTREYDLLTHIQRVHVQLPQFQQQTSKQIQKPASTTSTAMMMRRRMSVPTTATSTKRMPTMFVEKSSAATQKKPVSSIMNPPKQQQKQPRPSTSSSFGGPGGIRKSWPPLPVNTSMMMNKFNNPVSYSYIHASGWYVCNLCGKSFKVNMSFLSSLRILFNFLHSLNINISILFFLLGEKVYSSSSILPLSRK
jgi:hypothetical protein